MGCPTCSHGHQRPKATRTESRWCHRNRSSSKLADPLRPGSSFSQSKPQKSAIPRTDHRALQAGLNNRVHLRWFPSAKAIGLPPPCSSTNPTREPGFPASVRPVINETVTTFENTSKGRGLSPSFRPPLLPLVPKHPFRQGCSFCSCRSTCLRRGPSCGSNANR